MEYLVTAQEMKAYDRAAIERIGIPAPVLMERAALSVLEEIEARFAAVRSRAGVLVLAGVGNNGGDGLALARLLAEAGYQAEIVVCGDQDRASAEWLMQRSILENYPVPAGSKPAREEYTILIDALFGVGLSRPVEGKQAEWIRWFNGQEGFKIALDIPSGVGADDGKILGCAVRADLTVTFGFAKRGCFLYPGRGYAGQVVVKDAGIGERCFFGNIPGMFRLTPDAAQLLPKRRPDGNKGSFGKALLCAGSLNMAGAAVLAADGLYRIGAGMVRVITPQDNRLILQTAVPEALLGTPEQMEEGLAWADAAVVGPGLGKGPQAEAMLELVLGYGAAGCAGDCEAERSGVGLSARSLLPTVIDADGLNLLAENAYLQALLAAQAAAGRPFILTPHMGELARLAGKSIQETKEGLERTLRELSGRLHSVVVGKDAATVVCAEGESLCLCTAGNSGMATAGSGDVLAGIIGGLLAQGVPAFEAACRGVYLHAMAGDAAAARYGEHGCKAGDLVRSLAGLGAGGKA